MKQNHNSSLTVWLPMFLVTVLLYSCNQEYTIKPKAYPRIYFPEKGYEPLNVTGCPFTFEKPVYTVAVRDTTFFEKRVTAGEYWMNLEFPDFNGTINFTYKPITAATSFEKLTEDAYKLSYKHTRKADYIDEVRIENENGVSGMLYDVGGEAASNVQFYLTDSTKHFLRGALYFNNTPNADSMAPVVAFVKDDLQHLLKTFRWKDAVAKP